jgi:ABC-type branched-subunit amino acid transport system ATPase component
MDLIRTQDLTKLFDDFTAVDGVTLAVEAGEILALLGPNGAGKTTTIRMLTSILRQRGVRRRRWFLANTRWCAAPRPLTEHHGSLRTPPRLPPVLQQDVWMTRIRPVSGGRLSTV